MTRASLFVTFYSTVLPLLKRSEKRRNMSQRPKEGSRYCLRRGALMFVYGCGCRLGQCQLSRSCDVPELDDNLYEE